MKNTKEIKALFHLLDDPDMEIYNTVSNKLIHYGKDIIPNLENFWEHTEDNGVQERIENIIHKVNINDVLDRLNLWLKSDHANLLDGALILARFQFPDLREEEVRKVIRDIYQSCWLELNNYLTPLEQVNIVNSIFYNMFRFQGLDIEESKPNHFFINQVLETRTGNNYSLALLYQYLCSMLDIPVFAVILPKQYFLAYFSASYDYRDLEKNSQAKLQLYIDPCNGMVYSQLDVDAYIKKYELMINDENFKPQTPKQVLFQCIESLAYVYEQAGEKEKTIELRMMSDLFSFE